MTKNICNQYVDSSKILLKVSSKAFSAIVTTIWRPRLTYDLGADHYFLSGGYLFREEKWFASYMLAEKNCLLQGYEREKIVCKAKGNFLKYINISKF